MDLNYDALTRKIGLKEIFRSADLAFILITIIGVGGLGVSFLIFMAVGISTDLMICTSVFVFIITSMSYYSYSSIKTAIRLDAFAKQNQLKYTSSRPYDSQPGLIFQYGHSRIFRNVLSSSTHPFSEIGTYKFTTGRGKSAKTHTYGYIKMTLPRKLPNIILDSKKNNFLGKISNLPASLPSDQKLSLEGDFDSYFTLYAPEKYKTDALYVFTPDVMQALVNSAQGYDCEIIDDSLYLYSKSQLNLTSAKTFKEVVKITQLLKKEFTKQTYYYADARLGNRTINEVAKPGKRLKIRFSTAWIATAMSITLWFVYSVWMIFFQK